MNNDYTPLDATGEYYLADGVAICKMVEPVCAKHGFHVALTGGTLYGEGGRKDIDIVFYRIREVAQPDVEAMNLDLNFKCHMKMTENFGFCKKYIIGGVIPVDALFPEDWTGGYDSLDHMKVEKEVKL